MVALQLLSHLEGGRIECRPVGTRGKKGHAGPIGRCTEHYGSPGRLADYQRQLEKTARHEGEDPSIFAIALETLAVKAFGDMGPNVRLRLIQEPKSRELCLAVASR